MEVIARPQTGGAIAPIESQIDQAKHQDIDKSQAGEVLPEDSKVKADPMAPKFAALARKERALRQQMKEIQATELRLKAEKEEIEQARTWKSRLTQDPLSVMNEAGISYEQLTQYILNQPTGMDANYSKLQQEVAALKDAQLKASEQMTRAEDERLSQVRKQITTEVQLLVDGDEQFETLKAMNAQAAVVELIEEEFNKSGYLMPIDEAAKEVEDYLVEQAIGLAKLKKVQAQFAHPAPVEEPKKTAGNPQLAVKQTQSQQQSQLNTLSNRSIPAPAARPLTDKERKQRAILAFQGKL